MASVRLTILEAQGELPPVCMVCGKEAHEVVPKKFSWAPSRMYFSKSLLHFNIFPSVTTQRALLQAPLCPRHKNHWKKPTNTVLIGFMGLVFLYFLNVNSHGKTWQMVLSIIMVFFVLVWIIALIRLKIIAIRPKFISNLKIVLVNISPAFVDALVQYDKYQSDDEPRMGDPEPVRQTNPHIQPDRRSHFPDGIQE